MVRDDNVDVIDYDDVGDQWVPRGEFSALEHLLVSSKSPGSRSPWRTSSSSTSPPPSPSQSPSSSSTSPTSQV